MFNKYRILREKREIQRQNNQIKLKESNEKQVKEKRNCTYIILRNKNKLEENIEWDVNQRKLERSNEDQIKEKERNTRWGINSISTES